MAVHLQYFFNISLLEAFILNWKKNKEKIRVCVSSDRHIYTHIYEWIHWQQWNCTIIKWDIHLLMAELLSFPNTWSEGGWETIKDVPFRCPQTVSFWDTFLSKLYLLLFCHVGEGRQQHGWFLKFMSYLHLTERWKPFLSSVEVFA